MALSLIGKHVATALWAVALLMVVGTYLSIALPRLTRPRAVLATAFLLLALLVAAALAAGPAVTVLLLGATALLFGHAGWLWSEREGGNARGRLGSRAAFSEPGASSLPTPSALPEAGASVPAGPQQRSLGRYQIERELGRGSMGAVYLGRDPKIGRLVAIKTLALSKEFAGSELVEARKRFFREAETAGRLQHRDIVTIFDAGEDQELAYIAMEYLQGDNLQAHTQVPHLLSVTAVCKIVARVADALSYAHSQGIVHRDIKPANVMIDLTADIVKVTDFGIAHIADASRTRTGMVLGTPSFMSPEQLAGRRVDGRSDLYSLGVMLFQLLAGKLPHRSESMATLMQQIANEPAPDVRASRPELPEALAKIVALALEKRPEDRCPDGRLLAADLRAFAAQASTDANPSVAGTLTDPPDISGFEATVKLGPRDPRHNSSL